MTKMEKWSPEQIRNAAIYGVCGVCGSPRETRTETTGDETQVSLVCPNGHPQP